LPAYSAIAAEVGCTPGQLALAWLLHRSPHIVPIPGTTRLEHLDENIASASVVLSADVMKRVDEAIGQHNVHGERYAVGTQAEVDTERF
ncbi:MAG TPA: aldo/keto reductase, partial [Rubrivivax sp.]|nr:aldo/keto reductase [Rubrivivax sp.]